MKTRVISGIVIGVLALVTIYFGGILFKVTIAFVGLWGSYEYIKARNKAFNWFEYALMVIYTLLFILFNEKALALIICLLVSLIILAIFDSRVDITDISVTFLESVMSGFALYQALRIQALNKWLFGYIIILALVTDVFAYFSGVLLGKHKLCERISPKKTIEGFIGGWFCGLVISLIYAFAFNFFELDMDFIIICSIISPIISQLGDLAFSLIKRHYGIKDFSNLIPGHGGILDRFDSVTFTLLIFGIISIFLLK